MRRDSSLGRGRGFTLLEVVVVVAVIALLAAVLVPAVGRARESARSTKCIANLRSIGLGLRYYGDANRDYAVPRMVAGSSNPPTEDWPGPAGYPLWQAGGASAFWTDQNLLGQYCGSSMPDDPIGYYGGAVSKRSVFICPSDPRRNPLGDTMPDASYGLGSNFTMVMPTYGYSHMWRISTFDNPQLEMMVVDCFQARFYPGNFTPPYFFYGGSEPLVNGNWNIGDPNSVYNWAKRHSGGANVLFLDGHVVWVADLKKAYDGKEMDIHPVNE